MTETKQQRDERLFKAIRHKAPWIEHYLAESQVRGVLEIIATSDEAAGMVTVRAKALMLAVDAILKGLVDGDKDEFQEAYHQLLHAADTPDYFFHFNYGDHFYEWKRIAVYEEQSDG